MMAWVMRCFHGRSASNIDGHVRVMYHPDKRYSRSNRLLFQRRVDARQSSPAFSACSFWSSGSGARPRKEAPMVATTGSHVGTGGPPAGGKSRAARGGTFAALRFRNYRLFWFGQVVSVTGTFMQGTAQQWLVLKLSSSPLALGLVGAFQFTPSSCSPLSADSSPTAFPGATSWSRRKPAPQSSLSSSGSSLGRARSSSGMSTCSPFGLGLVNAVDMPTRQAFVSEMVGSGKPAQRRLAQLRAVQCLAHLWPRPRRPPDRDFRCTAALPGQRAQLPRRHRRPDRDAHG